MRTMLTRLVLGVLLLLGSVRFASAYYDAQSQRWLTRDPLDEEGGVDLFTFVFNDTENQVDPFGETIAGKVAVKICKLGAKGVKVLKKELSMKEAVDAVKEGEDVIARNRNTAKEIAKRAGGGKQPLHEVDKKTGGPHYHLSDRSGGHVLYSAAAALTLEHAAEGTTDFEKWLARMLDWFNPMTLPQDVLDIEQAICSDE